MLQNEPSINELAEHFFREEYTKIVAVVSQYFSASHLNLAEDVAQDTLLEAINNWEFKSIPPNPKAWLYTVAKNKALNIINRGEVHLKFEKEATFDTEQQKIAFEEEVIADQQLKMIFVCCHPSISQDAQIVLALKNLCGFSLSEISSAFMSNEDTINKRLVRARKTLKSENIQMDISMKERNDRLDQVLDVLYLIFNEGYYASQGNQIIRYDLCLDAIRLTKLLLTIEEYKTRGKLHALLALMYFNAARFAAREDSEGQMLDLSQQDRRLWDQELIANGVSHLESIDNEDSPSRFHLLAAISAEHVVSSSFEETRWKMILGAYDELVKLDHSDIVQLNRAVAVSFVNGPKKGLELVEKLDSLKNDFTWLSTKTKILIELERHEEAMATLEKARAMARSQAEKRWVDSKLQAVRKIF